ncbi:MAG: GerMN domain-containing protein [Leptonema sp. (in: bacteria)]
MINEDKTILILFASLILMIFLDIQAKKQQIKMKNEIKKISVEELMPMKNKIEEAKEILEDKMEIFSKDYHSISSIQENFKIFLPKNHSNKTILQLYYPKFVGKYTQMFKITKEISGDVTPEIALKNLQKGMGRGLVNAFYEGIEIEKLKYDKENKSMHLFFNDTFISKNQIVMKDRIDQICLVLKQFHEIQEIYYWINENLLYKVSDCKREFFEFK